MQLPHSFASQFSSPTPRACFGLLPAIAIAKLGIHSLVHLVSIDDDVRRLIPPEVSYLCSAKTDGVYPHIIIQFPKGSRVRLADAELCPPHANRIILVHDPANRDLVLDPGLPESLRGVRGFLPSGFNAMRDPALLRDRLNTVVSAMRELPQQAIVFYEDAGFHDNDLRAIVAGKLTGHVQIHSLNEDELQSYLGRAIDLLDVDDVKRALAAFRPYALAPTVVVHTKHWALAAGEKAASLALPLHGGIDLASARYCHGDNFTTSLLASVAGLPRQPESVRFADQLNTDPDFCCIPSHVLEVPAPTTIGLGDTFVGGFLAAIVQSEPQ